MRYIGGELPAAALRVLHVGHIHSQNHQADGLIPGGNPAQEKLIGSSLPLSFQLTVACFEGGLHRGGHLGPAVHGTEGSAHAGFIRGKEPPGCRVQTQHRPAAVQQHQPLVHILGDLIEFVGLSPETLQLIFDLFVLLMDAHQQRRQLLIGVVFQGVLQIQMVQWLHDLAGYPVG